MIYKNAFYTSGNWVLYRIISDSMGSVRMVVPLTTGDYWGPAGTLVECPTTACITQSFNFDDWGAANGSIRVPFGFAGGLMDTTLGTYRFGARDYNYWQRRWQSKDPIRLAGGVNLYAYCNNDPINCTDPTGDVGDYTPNIPLSSPSTDGSSSSQVCGTSIPCGSMNPFMCSNICRANGAACGPYAFHPYKGGALGTLSRCRTGFPTTTCSFTYPNGDVCTNVFPTAIWLCTYAK